jgi:hypothetical protein
LEVEMRVEMFKKKGIRMSVRMCFKSEIGARMGIARRSRVVMG